MDIGGYEIQKKKIGAEQYALIDVEITIGDAYSASITLEIPYDELKEAKDDEEVTWAEFNLDDFVSEYVSNLEVELNQISA